MNNINILIVIDALGATTSGSLMNNVYLVDTNKYLGSWHEGSDDLHTVCQDGQMLIWRVTSVSPSNDVDITGFTGQMISQKICQPQKQGIQGDIYWEGRIEVHGGIGQYSYTVDLTIDGRSMAFSPYIKVV